MRTSFAGGGAAIPGAILAGAGLLMLASLIAGLTLDFGDGNDTNSIAIRYRIKIIAMSGLSFGFFPAIASGAVVVAVAVLVALTLARGADPAVLRSIGNGAVAIAGVLALLTVAAVVIDVSLLTEDDFDGGNVAAAVVGDLAALALLAAAVLGGLNAARDAA